MAFSPPDVAAANAAQMAAATSPAHQTRLVAGPGTGKSKTIEERVRWLLENNIVAANIAVVSFTRASARDLESRIRGYGSEHGIVQMGEIKVSTLHSIALRVLRMAGLLEQYPVDPIVLDEWETRYIFDEEFSKSLPVSISRCASIRRHNEAYWQTGNFNPPNFVPPDPPIEAEEQHAFQGFHAARTQLYSCVLPGEIIRQCNEAISAGALVLNDLIHLEHLIVDEFQDLNPIDQEFVDYFIQADVETFVAGDDDQSIYSFRFAEPQGIQNFLLKYPHAVGHDLQHCFRYGNNILESVWKRDQWLILRNRRLPMATWIMASETSRRCS